MNKSNSSDPISLKNYCNMFSLIFTDTLPTIEDDIDEVIDDVFVETNDVTNSSSPTPFRNSNGIQLTSINEPRSESPVTATIADGSSSSTARRAVENQYEFV